MVKTINLESNTKLLIMLPTLPLFLALDNGKIEIPINSMYPSFRGRKLDKPNFFHKSIEEVTFLIANKK